MRELDRIPCGRGINVLPIEMVADKVGRLTGRVMGMGRVMGRVNVGGLAGQGNETCSG